MTPEKPLTASRLGRLSDEDRSILSNISRLMNSNDDNRSLLEKLVTPLDLERIKAEELDFSSKNAVLEAILTSIMDEDEDFKQIYFEFLKEHRAKIRKEPDADQWHYNNNGLLIRDARILEVPFCQVIDRTYNFENRSEMKEKYPNISDMYRTIIGWIKEGYVKNGTQKNYCDLKAKILEAFESERLRSIKTIDFASKTPISRILKTYVALKALVNLYEARIAPRFLQKVELGSEIKDIMDFYENRIKQSRLVEITKKHNDRYAKTRRAELLSDYNKGGIIAASDYISCKENILNHFSKTLEVDNSGTIKLKY